MILKLSPLTYLRAYGPLSGMTSQSLSFCAYAQRNPLALASSENKEFKIRETVLNYTWLDTALPVVPFSS